MPSAVKMQWGVRIQLRDGIGLNATLYLPRELIEPAPAVLTLTPYVGQTYHDVGMYFASNGYPFVAVDVRGRGNSEGTFRPLINEPADASDVISWLASQPYCNGKVAMWGGSYGGHVQWAAARECPKSLQTIVPVASPHVGSDFPIRNNIAAPYWMQWLTLVAGRTSQDRLFWSNGVFWGEMFRDLLKSGVPFVELDAQVGNPSGIFQEWASHPQLDAYWDAYNPSAVEYARISIPVLTITGIYDDDQLGALMHYREHLRHRAGAQGAAHFLVIGPWDHAGTRVPSRKFSGIEVGDASLVDLRKLHLDWYTWIMRSGPRPEFLRRKVAYYVLGAECWRYADSLEDITERYVRFYLRSDNNNTNDVFKSGSLSTVPPRKDGPAHYVYDPCDTRLAELESKIDPEDRADHRMVYAAAGRRLVYHSEPFEQDTVISGFVRLSLWLSIDQPDTDFSVSLYEVHLDGTAIQLTTDVMRARYRESLREQKLVSNARPLRYDFERFTFTSAEVRKGHRLRLVIGPNDSIYSQRNYNTGGAVALESGRDARVVTVFLHHDELHPSVLDVPLGRTARDED